MKKISLIISLSVLYVFFVFNSTHASFIELTSPNGGEVWKAGETHNITWNKSSDVISMGIGYGTGPGSLNHIETSILFDAGGTTGSYIWKIPENLLSSYFKSKEYLIKLTSYSEIDHISLHDESDDYFTILSSLYVEPEPVVVDPPAAIITSPSSNTSLQIGASHTISWQSITNDNYRYVDLFLDMGKQTDGKHSLVPISSFNWTRGSIKLNNAYTFNKDSYPWSIPSSVDLSVVNFGSIAYSYSLFLNPDTNEINIISEDVPLINGTYALPAPTVINSGKYRIYAIFSDGGVNNNYVFSDYFSIGSSAAVQSNTPYSLDSRAYTGVNSNRLDFRVNWLVKNKKFAEVFWADSDMCLHWIINEEIAERNFGVTWNYKGTIKEFESVSEYGYKFCDNLE